MADKKLNAVSTASDGAYIYAEDASSNQIKISKADLATVVAEQIKPIVNKGRKNESGNTISDANEIVLPGIYTFARAGDVTGNQPPFTKKDLMMIIIVSSYDNSSLIQTAICGTEIHSREYYGGTWQSWV